MNNQPTFGFVVEYVTDIEASRNFYVNVLGLKVERHAPDFVQFDTFAIASDDPMEKGSEFELYWLVGDAEAAYSDLSHKAEVCLPLEQKPFGKVFGIKNSAGKPRYLLELASERPSENLNTH